MKKMKNPPVFFVIVQVKFNTVLNLEDYLPKIQDKMRTIGFPDYKKEIAQQISFAFEEGKPSVPAATTVPRYLFGSADKNTEFLLETSALTLQTSNYDTSDIYFDKFKTGLSIVKDILNLEFTERIGLRYFDAVLPQENESIDEYFAPEVLGIGNKLSGKIVHSYSENVTITTYGVLVSRLIIRPEGKVGLPAEMISFNSRINSRFLKEGPHGIVDTDAFYEQREPFDLGKIILKLDQLHGEIWKSLEATASKHAFAAWI